MFQRPEPNRRYIITPIHAYITHTYAHMHTFIDLEAGMVKGSELLPLSA